MIDRPDPPATRPIRRALVIWNPVSGFAKRIDPGARVSEVLSGDGVEVELAPTEGPGHATELAAEACVREFDVVVAVGGDGTVNEACNGMQGGRTALATVPTGTSNMLAREFRIPFKIDAAAGLIAIGRRRRMDVGRANGRRFLMVVGVGWDAEIVSEVSARRSGHLGMHKYVAPIARTVLNYRFPRLTVHLDSEETPRTANLAYACNIKNYAAWFRLAPGARCDDGRLDFVLMKGRHPRNYLRWGLGAVLGTLPRYRDVTVRRGRRIRIDSRDPVPFQIDGDPGGTTPLTIELEESALEIIVP